MSRKDVGRLIKKVRSQPGWSARLVRAGHWRITGPHGALVFMASTPSDSRGLRNARAELRRRGARV